MVETARQRSPEVEETTSNTTGLQGRLLLARPELLNPENPCTQEALQSIVGFDDRGYGSFQKASVTDRAMYWNTQIRRNLVENSQSAIRAAWQEKVVASFNKDNSPISALSPLLSHIGIASEPGGFTKAHAAKLYGRYFSSNDENAGVKKFVADVLETYQQNGTIDKVTILQHAKELTWLANIFGEKAKDMVRELVFAETNLKTAPNFVQTLSEAKDDPVTHRPVMRINDLNSYEKRILKFISGMGPDIEPGNEESESPEIPGELPIEKHRTEIQDHIRNNDTTLVIGGTGSGKTMRVPQMIREIMGPNDKLIVTEPRQINTSELAANVAREAGVTLGKEIGFQHGADSNYSDESDTIFMTEGTLILKLLEDDTLKETNYVMVDEIHVRTKDTEKLLELLKQAQQKRRQAGIPPLKIIGASATVNKQELQDYFGVDKSIEVEGRTFPIRENFSDVDIPSDQMPQASAKIVKDIVQNGRKGDICIAIAGVADIGKHAQAILAENPDVMIVRLHSGSSQREKDEVGKPPPPGKRRVIIGTDFIQTGVTIKDLKFVINTGEQFQQTVDPRSGLEYISRTQQSKAEIAQWSGRVGRTSPGTVYNLFTKTNYDQRQEYPTPEIRRTDLTDVVLEIKLRGIQDFSDFKVLSYPLDQERLEFANETLLRLGALNPDKTINAIGKRMVELPTDYHFARMIVEAQMRRKGVKEICTIAALAEARSLFSRDRAKADAAMTTFKNPNSDFLTLLNIWRAYEANGKSSQWAEENGLNPQSLTQAEKAIDKLVKRGRGDRSPQATDEELEHYIFTGLRDRLMQYDPIRRSYRWNRSNAVNLNLRIDRRSALSPATPPYIVAASNSPVENGRAVFVSNCQRVKPEWITN